MPETISEWLAAVPPPEHDLAEVVLGVVRDTLEHATGTVKWNQPCFVVAESNCLYLSAQDGYVNLGFYEGAHLDDPAGLLDGSGKAMRHVKVHDTESLEDPDLEALIRMAEAHARS